MANVKVFVRTSHADVKAVTLAPGTYLSLLANHYLFWSTYHTVVVLYLFWSLAVTTHRAATNQLACTLLQNMDSSVKSTCHYIYLLRSTDHACTSIQNGLAILTCTCRAAFYYKCLGMLECSRNTYVTCSSFYSKVRLPKHVTMGQTVWMHSCTQRRLMKWLYKFLCEMQAK